MGDLKLNGATSGTITLTPTAVAGTNTITLPASTGTVVVSNSSGNASVSGGFTVGGSLGVGTTSPARKLDVEEAGTNYQLRIGDAGGNYYDVGRDTSNGLLTFYGNQAVASGYVFSTVNGERMRIDTSGNVGIGTSSPGYKLTVNGQTSFAANQYVRVGAALFAAGDGSTINYLFCGSTALAVRNSADSAEFMRIDTSGNLLVGTTTVGPGYLNSTKGVCFQQDGTAYFSKTGNITVVVNNNTSGNALTQYFYQGTYVGQVLLNGTTGVLYQTSSDYRLKENIAPLSGGLKNINSLRPVTYDWISDQSKGEGFIAHELQLIIPAAVSGAKDAVNEDGKPILQGVDYSRVVPHLVAAIQELSAKNDALEARLAALEAK